VAWLLSPSRACWASDRRSPKPCRRFESCWGLNLLGLAASYDWTAWGIRNRLRATANATHTALAVLSSTSRCCPRGGHEGAATCWSNTIDGASTHKMARPVNGVVATIIR
jgi:hypothetical protein